MSPVAAAQPEQAAEEHGGRARRDGDLQRARSANYPNGCHVCELEIDEETGSVEIVDYSVVDDVGTVINPLLVHGQIDGGIAQGVGQMLMEDIRFDEQGQILTGSFMDYAMPRAGRPLRLPRPQQSGADQDQSARRQGCGEAGCVGALPAVANALVDALSVLGVKRHRDAGDAGAGVARDPGGAGEKRLTEPGYFTDC